MRKLILNALIMLGLSTGVANAYRAGATLYYEMPEGLYKLDRSHAQLIWRVSHMGMSNYTARFTKFDASLTFDPKNPTNSKLSATVDPTSIKTDYPYPEEKDFDALLVNDKDWFNAVKFPNISFESKEIKSTGDYTATMVGDLTFLGVTKPVSLNVTYNESMAKHPFTQKPIIGFSATGNLNRSEWGMDSYIPIIGDKVELIIEAEFVQD